MRKHTINNEKEHMIFLFAGSLWSRWKKGERANVFALTLNILPLKHSDKEIGWVTDFLSFGIIDILLFFIIICGKILIIDNIYFIMEEKEYYIETTKYLLKIKY